MVIHNAGSCGDTLVHNDWNDENEYEDEHDDDENNCDECIADESSEVIHYNNM